MYRFHFSLQHFEPNSNLTTTPSHNLDRPPARTMVYLFVGSLDYDNAARAPVAVQFPQFVLGLV